MTTSSEIYVETLEPWRSDSIGALAAALAKAQAKIRNAQKDSSNPYFKSRYADLASVWDACRAALSENELSVSQHPRMEFRGEPEIVKLPTRGGDGERVVVRCIMVVSLTTRLLHASGEWMASTVQSILPGADPQTVGSAITYLRRYGLASMVGVAPDDDDDGNAAVTAAAETRSATAESRAAKPHTQPPPGFGEWWTDIVAVADEGTDALQTAWIKSPVELRRYLTEHHPDRWEGVKARASKAGRVTA